MPLNIAIQCDPPARFDPTGDSTIALGLAAQARGHRLFYYLPHELTCHDGKIEAPLRPITFFDDARRWFAEEKAARADLATMDVILIRQDPPFDMGYITATYLLERLQGPLVLNDPRSLRNHPEKLIPLEFPDLVPPTLIARDAAAIEAFFETHGDIVVKPLYGFAGYGVFRCRKAGDNFRALIELLMQGTEPLIAQAFLPEVRSREMRVHIIDGRIVSAFQRIPHEDDIRSNLRAGGSARAIELTTAERGIAERIGAWCASRGFMLVGLDLIGEALIEVNVTSPTGLRMVRQLYGIDAAALFWNAVEAGRRT